MSVHPNYYRCVNYLARPVRVRTRDGQIYTGTITRVTNTHVFLRPMPARTGYGYGLWGFGWGFGIGIALGAIVGLAAYSWWW
ncbi:hypothetical protein [Bacillus kwashiorkori]|uniref:hypothetical protein n=1 Tax=Bacillus kwashiorkori TaxID=1522318 RepID=UPI00078078BD|nr:hypothetical protein [Bacillus kwashiorkori]